MRRVRNIFISDGANDNEPEGTFLRSARHITRLLGLVSASVETLALHCDNPRTSTSLLAFLFGLHYPRLRELTVVGYYPFPHVPNAMPRLNYLHLNGNRNPHGLLQMGSLDAVCPELTHLRISGLSRATAFAAELVDAVTADDASQALFNATLPSKVRRVVVQPGPVVHTPKLVSARLSDDCMMDKLESLDGGGATKRGLQYSLLKRSVSGDIAVTSKRHWLDRLDGGDGCWEVST